MMNFTKYENSERSLLITFNFLFSDANRCSAGSTCHKTLLPNVPVYVLCIALFTACGGSVNEDVTALPSPRFTTAVLTLSTKVSSLMPPSTAINSYDITVTLPAGVTVKSTTNPPTTDDGVVTAIGSAAGSLVVALYTAPTNTQAGTVKIYVINVNGFRSGAFSVVNCDITEGFAPTTSNFAIPTLDSATGFDSATGTTVLGLEEVLSLTSTVVLQ